MAIESRQAKVAQHSRQAKVAQHSRQAKVAQHSRQAKLAQYAGRWLSTSDRQSLLSTVYNYNKTI
ncbi:MAG: hypothetical protein R6V34_05390 [Bacteroidales bacterium]